ncbi:MAG: hypothetical protein VKJ02_02405 [Snowella sp.]|nr:hypothetical protein [Snowella sp.]
MFWKIRQMGGVIWQYVNQPVFSPRQDAIWKPSRFWYVYKIQLLENCWQMSGSESHSNS